MFGVRKKDTAVPSILIFGTGAKEMKMFFSQMCDTMHFSLPPIMLLQKNLIIRYHLSTSVS